MLLATTRFEINAFGKGTNPALASEFAARHNCPAIITLPELVAPFMADREAKRALYKVMVLLDFPNGQNFAMQKFRGREADLMAADGFDIICTPGLQLNQARNEIKSVTEFIKQLNPVAEVRWVVGAHHRRKDEYEGHLKAIGDYPCNFIRLDQLTARPGVKTGAHKAAIKTIRGFVNTPIKISGNVDASVFEAFRADRKTRFDVSLEQATTIVRHYEQAKTTTETQNESKKEEELGGSSDSKQEKDKEESKEVIGTPESDAK